MKHFLFLPFLVNFACVDAVKSALGQNEDDPVEDDGELTEGQTQGDCYDGEDNDDDGDIDCEDAGCFNKPACNDTGWEVPDDTGTQSDSPNFEGYFEQSFSFGSDYQSQGYNNCSVTLDMSANTTMATNESSCPSCSVVGITSIVQSTSCSFVESGEGIMEIGVNVSSESFWMFDSTNNQWVEWLSVTECNNNRVANATSSSLTITCISDIDGGSGMTSGYTTTANIALTW